MKKRAAALMVTAFAFCAGTAFAKSEKCTVDTAEGDTVTMTCKKTKLKAGDKVQVKVKKEKAVEGC
ncbi:MAG: hypothetical protein D3924_06870 [Candidatus Electrothrix sp. AR4]|nr:hypothetical protein [Candidatus Electrothrix sp. AR4]